MRKFKFIIIFIILLCGIGAWANYLYKRSALYLAFNDEARHKLEDLVNAKHRILPKNIILTPSSKHSILTNTKSIYFHWHRRKSYIPYTKEESQRDTFTLNKRGEYYYLDSHGGVRLFMYPPKSRLYQLEGELFKYWCNRRSSCPLTIFVSEDAKTYIIIRHDTKYGAVKYEWEDEWDYEALFYVYRLHDGEWFIGGFASNFFPPRPKGWAEARYTFEVDYGAIFEYLEKEN